MRPTYEPGKRSDPSPKPMPWWFRPAVALHKQGRHDEAERLRWHPHPVTAEQTTPHTSEPNRRTP